MDRLMLPKSSVNLHRRHTTTPPKHKYKHIKHVSLPHFKQTACTICKKSFGVRKRHRKKTCKRCNNKVCEDCSTAKRYDFSGKQLVRVCDECRKNEHRIKISHRINNLRLKSKRNKGIYIAKTAESSREYKDGFVTNSRVIEINNINVESSTAQQIANKLNMIKLPFSMILDYTEAIIGIHELQTLLSQRRHNKPKHSKSASMSASLYDAYTSTESVANVGGINDDSNESKSVPSSPKISSLSMEDASLTHLTAKYDIGPIDDDTEYHDVFADISQMDTNIHINGDKDELEYPSTDQVKDSYYRSSQELHANRNRHPHHHHHRGLYDYKTVTNPHRQFCVVFDQREFDLCLQFRNGYNLFIDNRKRKTYSPQIFNIPQNHIWGWYTVKNVSQNKHIPIGSKLISINGRMMTNIYNQNNVNQLLSDSALPITLIFEAPSYLKTLPRSTHIQYDHNKATNTRSDTNHLLFLSPQNYHILLWWLEEGGFVLILLTILAFIVLDWPLQFLLDKWYLFLLLLGSIPNVSLSILRWLFLGRTRFRIFSIFKKEPLSIAYSIVHEHRLNVHGIHRSKHYNKEIEKHQSEHIKLQQQQQQNTVIAQVDIKQQSNKPKIIEEHKDIEEVIGDKQDEIDLLEIDPNWETNLCHPNGSKEIWGSYCLGSSPLLSVRGKTYLTDKIKIKSKQALFNIGHVEVFESHKTIKCMAQNEASWFYQNRAKFPRNLFFFIFHLRLDSLHCSIVIYWYIDKDKYKSLLTENAKIAKMAKNKGDGYWCIGSNNYDESGMFWDFINGECRYRNDRLKMIARKEEGSWYLHIPSTPAIIAKKIPMIYYRGYNKQKLNSIKTDNNTKSESYESYRFNTLYHEEKKEDKHRNIGKVPCQCGKCHWIDTKNKYPEFLELHFNPESASPIAKNTIKIAAGVTKSLSWELHFLLEGQRNNIELPETVLANARISYIHLDSMIQID